MGELSGPLVLKALYFLRRYFTSVDRSKVPTLWSSTLAW